MAASAARRPLGAGWDSVAVLVDGLWVERTARRREVEPWLRTETRLLPWLAPRLPLPVPEPVVVAEDPLTVRHRLIPGTPWTAPRPAQGRAVGAFLAALHGVGLDAAVARGVPGPERTRALRVGACARFAADVAPRLAPGLRPALSALLARVAAAPASVLVHGDLNADHVRVRADGGVAGVIDWSDARAGDPAKDLADPLHVLPDAVADALLAGYGADPAARAALVARAADWHRVGPCYAVAHGLDTGDPALVADALAALGARLAPPPGAPPPGPAAAAPRILGRCPPP